MVFFFQALDGGYKSLDGTAQLLKTVGSIILDGRKASQLIDLGFNHLTWLAEATFQNLENLFHIVEFLKASAYNSKTL